MSIITRVSRVGFIVRHSFQAYVCAAPLSVTLPNIQRRRCSTQILSHPTADGCEKDYPPKIRHIVEEIAKLTLIEVSDLNELLKKTLNIKDAPMGIAAMPIAAPASVEDEDAEPAVVKTSFTLKLMKYDESKKVALIKELKNLLDGMNLVQAKKFVEAAPQIVKADIAKDEAEKLKQAIEAVGGTCEIA